ncbi:uncharacterized protein RSE6_12382 [Rhynchosporium secalis]|uniref:Uncharacterized protein n=1 Tax=Rhynchosporium secalis TaxID=38038 RepID=A0A1E1MQC0_RHYSE|nr:uncharacterized protein RSE6_12382 [Rhynchosporium secalis]
MPSSIPSIIEDEIVQQYHRLKVQVMAMYNSWTTTSKTVLDLVMRRTYHFMGYALAARWALLTFSEDMEYARDGASPKDGSTVLQHAPEELQVE